MRVPQDGSSNKWCQLHFLLPALALAGVGCKLVSMNIGLAGAAVSLQAVPSTPHLNSTVPTAVLGSMGVNRKWLRGDTTTTSNCSTSMTCQEQQQVHEASQHQKNKVKKHA
jgi:hypothetical protein